MGLEERPNESEEAKKNVNKTEKKCKAIGLTPISEREETEVDETRKRNYGSKQKQK